MSHWLRHGSFSNQCSNRVWEVAKSQEEEELTTLWAGSCFDSESAWRGGGIHRFLLCQCVCEMEREAELISAVNNYCGLTAALLENFFVLFCWLKWQSKRKLLTENERNQQDWLSWFFIIFVKVSKMWNPSYKESRLPLFTAQQHHQILTASFILVLNNRMLACCQTVKPPGLICEQQLWTLSCGKWQNLTITSWGSSSTETFSTCGKYCSQVDNIKQALYTTWPSAFYDGLIQWFSNFFSHAPLQRIATERIMFSCLVFQK